MPTMAGCAVERGRQYSLYCGIILISHILLKVAHIASFQDIFDIFSNQRVQVAAVLDQRHNGNVLCHSVMVQGRKHPKSL